jgi:hypothetical protein
MSGFSTIPSVESLAEIRYFVVLGSMSIVAFLLLAKNSRINSLLLASAGLQPYGQSRASSR